MTVTHRQQQNPAPASTPSAGVPSATTRPTAPPPAPASPVPAAVFDAYPDLRLPSDFYGFADAFTDAEAESVLEGRRFFAAEVAPVADDHWERAEFPRHLIAPLGRIGVMGTEWESTRRFPSSALYQGWLALEMSRVDASVGTFVGVSSGLTMTSLTVCGSPEQQAEWMPRLASAEAVGAFGLTEPLSGSDAAKGLRTTATRRGDTWVLSGEKRWIGNATFADVVVVWARDTADDQVKGFLVTKGSPGFTATKIEGKTALRAVENADIVLDGVEVPEERRLPRAQSFKDTAEVLRLTRAGVAWQGIGVAVGAYEAALAYAITREQFGKPIASHQLVQDLLVRSIGDITASIAMCARLAALQDTGGTTDAQSSMAKSWVTSRMREVVARCREVCGGNGIVLETGVARFVADAEAIYSYEGTREMNTLIVGRAITGHAAFV